MASAVNSLLLWILNCSLYRNQLRSLINMRIPGCGPKINKLNLGVAQGSAFSASLLLWSRDFSEKYCSSVPRVPSIFTNTKDVRGTQRPSWSNLCDRDCTVCPGQRRWVGGQTTLQTYLLFTMLCEMGRQFITQNLTETHCKRRRRLSLIRHVILYVLLRNVYDLS